MIALEELFEDRDIKALVRETWAYDSLMNEVVLVYWRVENYVVWEEWQYMMILLIWSESNSEL